MSESNEFETVEHRMVELVQILNSKFTFNINHQDFIEFGQRLRAMPRDNAPKFTFIQHLNMIIPSQIIFDLYHGEYKGLLLRIKKLMMLEDAQRNTGISMKDLLKTFRDEDLEQELKNDIYILHANEYFKKNIFENNELIISLLLSQRKDAMTLPGIYDWYGQREYDIKRHLVIQTLIINGQTKDGSEISDDYIIKFLTENTEYDIQRHYQQVIDALDKFLSPESKQEFEKIINDMIKQFGNCRS